MMNDKNLKKSFNFKSFGYRGQGLSVNFENKQDVSNGEQSHG